MTPPDSNGSATRPTRGRPPTPRATWNADTFTRLYQALGLSITEVADATDGAVSVHTIRRWQSISSAAMPTLEQRAIVAKAINTLTGKQFSGPDLGRAIAGVGFKFRAPGSSR